jgi:phosphatidylglycerol lysyltransferase
MPVDRVAALFERFGHDTVSSQALEPGLSYWFHGDDACVAYRDTGGAWVAAGGPICAIDKRDETMQAFVKEAESAGKRVRFFAIEHQVDALTSVSIGQQPEWDPNRWKETLASKASLREQLRRARAKSVVVREPEGAEIADEGSKVHRQICRMVRDWQKNRAMAPMSFLVSLDLFGHQGFKRYFVAEQEGRVVAILVTSPIPARSGWFFEDVLRAHDAPNGSVELLFDHAMRAAADEGVEVVSYGLAPLAGEVGLWLKRVRDHSRWLYDFEGLRAFKAKLMPHQWRPVYLAFPRKERGIRATIDSLTAFAGGSWIRFGIRTIVHAQPTLVWWLALLLLPWTLVLTMAPVGHWFPSVEIKAAWIAFDLFLFAALIHLAIDWRRSKARLLSLVAGCDFALGTTQLVLFNREHLHSSGDWFLASLALGAPLGAAVILAMGASMRDRLYLPVPAEGRAGE